MRISYCSDLEELRDSARFEKEVSINFFNQEDPIKLIRDGISQMYDQYLVRAKKKPNPKHTFYLVFKLESRDTSEGIKEVLEAASNSPFRGFPVVIFGSSFSSTSLGSSVIYYDCGISDSSLFLSPCRNNKNPIFIHCYVASCTIHGYLDEAFISDRTTFHRCLFNGNISDCKLEDTTFENCHFTGNASGTFPNGLPANAHSDPEAIKRFLSQLERDDEGFIVYKGFGRDKDYVTPDYWNISEGQIISESVDKYDRHDCSWGINCGTFDWVVRSYPMEVWKCRIRWEFMTDLVVPTRSDGKVRVARLELIRPLTEDEKYPDKEN